MKTAIYIEDGIVQLVLTPETEFEKNAMSSFENEELETKIFSGSFYDCRGGWVRQKSYYQPAGMYNCGDSNDKSIILSVKKVKNET